MLIQYLMMIVAAYSLFGFAFAIYFVSFGVARLDPAARSAPLLFRALILPGAAALWPFLALRLLRRAPSEAE